MSSSELMPARLNVKREFNLDFNFKFHIPLQISDMENILILKDFDKKFKLLQEILKA